MSHVRADGGAGISGRRGLRPRRHRPGPPQLLPARCQLRCDHGRRGPGKVGSDVGGAPGPVVREDLEEPARVGDSYFLLTFPSINPYGSVVPTKISLLFFQPNGWSAAGR